MNASPWLNRTLSRSRALLSLLAIPLALAISGCNSGEQVYPVKGKVVFADGSPAMFGDIEFQSSSKPVNARGKIQRDGTFVLGTNRRDDGAIEGEHKVVISQVVTNHFNLDVVHDHGDLVHGKYASYATTDLTVMVKPESNELVLEVDKREEPQ